MWEDDTWDLKFAAQLPSNRRFLQAVDAWSKGVSQLEDKKVDAAIDSFADCLLLSERGAMVSGRFIDSVPSLAQRLVERGRDDPKSLILSAWINLVLATLKHEDRDARVSHYKRAISCYEVLLELQPKNGRVWLLLGGAQQLLNPEGDECISSWRKAYQIDPDLCLDSKFLVGAALYNRAEWVESRKALETFVKSCGLDHRLASAAYFLLCLLCFKSTPPVEVTVTAKETPESLALAMTYYVRGMEAELVRGAWMPKSPPSVPRRDAQAMMQLLERRRCIARQPALPTDSVAKRVHAMLMLLSFTIITYLGTALGWVLPAIAEWVDAVSYTGTETSQWVWWSLVMCVRAALTFGLFFLACNVIDTVALRMRRGVLVKDVQALDKTKTPKLVG